MLSRIAAQFCRAPYRAALSPSQILAIFVLLTTLGLVQNHTWPSATGPFSYSMAPVLVQGMPLRGSAGCPSTTIAWTRSSRPQPWRLSAAPLLPALDMCAWHVRHHKHRRVWLPARRIGTRARMSGRFFSPAVLRGDTRRPGACASLRLVAVRLAWATRPDHTLHAGSHRPVDARGWFSTFGASSSSVLSPAPAHRSIIPRAHHVWPPSTTRSFGRSCAETCPPPWVSRRRLNQTAGTLRRAPQWPKSPHPAGHHRARKLSSNLAQTNNFYSFVIGRYSAPATKVPPP